MNSYVLVSLAGDVGGDALIVGPYADLDSALAALVTTGQPFNFQIATVWGPATTPPPYGSVQAPYEQILVEAGAWIAITPGNSENGGIRLFGYGTFASKADARSWANSQPVPAAFSFGQVLPTV